MPETRVFVVESTFRRREVEHAWALRRWATGVRWIEVAVGALFLAAWMGDVRNVGAWPLGIVGLLLLTGWSGRLYRLLFASRGQEGLRSRITVDENGLGYADEGQSIHWEWSAWGACLAQGDLLLLFTKQSGNAAMLMLAKQFAQADEWPSIVTLVTSHVPAQRRRFGLPRPRTK